MTSDALIALEHETQALSAVLHEVTPEELARTTNCPPWNLQELVVHTADSIRLEDTPFPPAEPSDRPTSAAGYYRRPERGTASCRQGNVDHTVQMTRTVVAETTAVRWFDQVARDSIATLRKRELDRVVTIPGRGAMRLDEWVVTRVISVAAHGLDVAITLGRAPWTTPPALRAVRPVFVALLDAEPPGTLDWDDRTLLATGSGRRALTEHERELLGAHASRFPLLS